MNRSIRMVDIYLLEVVMNDVLYKTVDGLWRCQP